MELRGAAEEVAKGLGVKRISLTITHSGNIALAQVIFEG
jgi:phosphopantetheinyl transferase (holo-ACP synthase)